MMHEFRGTNFWDTLYFTLVCLWCGRTVGRSVYGHVITKFSTMGSLPPFLTHGAPLRALRARELPYNGGYVSGCV